MVRRFSLLTVAALVALCASPAAAQVDITGLTTGGTVLGLFPEVLYDEGTLDLCPGDLLVAYTDGVTEALDPSGELFSESRLVEVLRRLAGRAPGELVKALNDELLAFADGAAQADDITLLALRYRGETRSHSKENG